MDGQILYTPEQAGAVLALGRSKVFELIASGDLTSVQIGRSRRIPRRSLEDYAGRLLAEATSGAA